MNRYSLSVIFSLIFLTLGFSNAQNVKSVSPLGTNEEFFVLKTNKKVRHGEYKKFHPHNSKSIIIKGLYENNERVGIWEYFDLRGVLNLRFDYTNKKVLLFNSYILLNVSKVLSSEPQKKLTTPPIYLNGEYALFEWFAKNVIYPEEAVRTKSSGTIMVYLTIDKFGKAKDYHVKDSPGFGLDIAALRAVKSIPSEFWFPGMINNEAVDVEITIPINFFL